MTIDEAIKDLRYDAQCNRANLDIEWAERNEQLAEWLEELKKLTQNRNEFPLATITFSKKDLQKMVDEKVKDIELDIQGIRNQAIDDFVKECEAEYDNDDCPGVSDYLDYKLSLREIFEIAEQLKEWSVDNE